MAVSEQLRKRIVDSGLTHYRIGTDTGINIRTIDRFIGEGIPIKSFTLDTLCEYFGLELAEEKPGTAPKEGGKKPGTAPKRAKKKTTTKRKQAKKSAE